MSRLRRFYFTGSPIFEPLLERRHLSDTNKKSRQGTFLVGITAESPAARAWRRSSGSRF
jgi:hypothetical protein